jgi:hypothetical protein
LSISIGIEVELAEHAVRWEPTQDVVADFVDGWAFGNAIGVGIRSMSGWWTVTDISFTRPIDVSAVVVCSIKTILNSIFQGLSLTLLQKSRIALSQTRIIPIRLDQTKPFRCANIKFKITLTSGSSTAVVDIDFPITHHALWTLSQCTVIQASYFFGQSNPTAFLVLPPREDNSGAPSPPILALRSLLVLKDNLWFLIVSEL